MLQTMNRMINLTFQNANQWCLNPTYGDNEYGIAMLDLDGSTTGLPYGGWLVSNQPSMINNDCTFRSEWNGYMCPPSAEGYVALTLVDNLNAAPISDGYTAPTNQRAIRAKFTRLDTRQVGT
jgi:hypothetical protein